MFEQPLNKDTVDLYAAKIYLGVSKADFDEDYKLFSAIKKSISRWQNNMDEVVLARSLNQLTIVINAFSTIGAARILFYKARPDQYPILKTLLLYLGHLPADIPEVNLPMIKFDDTLVSILRKADPRHSINNMDYQRYNQHAQSN